MKVVVAIDSFKGCLSSAEANAAAAEGVRSVVPDAKVLSVPVSDGGEGFLEACASAVGGERVRLTVHDPLMRPTEAQYLLCGPTAFIESAQACGLTLLQPHERNPLITSSYGLGEIVANAVGRGATHVVVGLGGSGTSDVGIGMLRALSDAFSVEDIALCDTLRHVRFTLASDVQNPLCGPDGAAHGFSIQKGATNAMLPILEERARTFANDSAVHMGFDRSEQKGAGAAGGLGYAFLQYLNAEYQSGVHLLLDLVRFSEKTKGAALIITGEGSADRQTLMGKLPMGILQRAQGVPVVLIAGMTVHEHQLREAGFAQVVCINPPDLPIVECLKPDVARRNIRHTVAQVLSQL